MPRTAPKSIRTVSNIEKGVSFSMGNKVANLVVVLFKNFLNEFVKREFK